MILHMDTIFLTLCALCAMSNAEMMHPLRESLAKNGSDNFSWHMRGGGTAITAERLNGEGLVVVGGVRVLLLDVWVL